jgi:hypothetical protein
MGWHGVITPHGGDYSGAAFADDEADEDAGDAEKR